MRKSFALASFVFALALAPALAGDTKDGWGWTLTKGEKVRHAYVANVEAATEIMGMPLKATHNSRLELVEETTEVKDDVASIEATIARIVIKIQMPTQGGGNQSMAFDSDQGKEEKGKKKADDDDDEDGGKSPLEGAVRPAIGQKFTFKMAKDGSITEVKGLEEITAKLSHQQGQMASMLLDPEVLQQLLEAHRHLFPAPGTTGDSWDIPTTITLPNMGLLVFKRTITPKGKTDGGEKLDELGVKPEIKPTDKGAGAPNPMMAALGKPKVKETSFTGHAVFAKDKGQLVSDELVAKMTSEFGIDPKMMGGGGGKKMGGDDDDDDDAPKKKDEKKDDTKKDDGKKDEKKKDDDDDDSGDGKVKITQKFKLVMRFEVVGNGGSTEK